MQERGINSAFKKLIYESSEMVFLVDDSYPHPIFYANKSFEEKIGSSLTDRSLVGLGIDISSLLFKDKFVFSHAGNDFEFLKELPQDSSTNYFLFYKGMKIRTQGLPTNNEFQQFLLESPNAQLIVKSDGKIFHANNEALQLFGYAQDKPLNHISELERNFIGSHQWQKWIRTSISESKTHRFTSTFISLGGDQLNFEIVSKYLLIEEIQYVILSFQNISEKVSLEKNLEDSSNFLLNLTEQVVYISW